MRSPTRGTRTAAEQVFGAVDERALDHAGAARPRRHRRLHCARRRPCGGEDGGDEFDAAEALATHPHLGRAGRIAGTRELVVAQTPFVVPYRVVGDDVQILAVFHGARRWPEGFE